jgi:hypothetical protein
MFAFRTHSLDAETGPCPCEQLVTLFYDFIHLHVVRVEPSVGALNFEWVPLLGELLSSCPNGTATLIAKFLNPMRLRQYLLECPHAQVRVLYANFVYQIFSSTVAQQRGDQLTLLNDLIALIAKVRARVCVSFLLDGCVNWV